MFTNKKGLAVWVSWVLVVGMAVVLGTFFFNFIRGLAESSVEELIERNGQSEICDAIAIRVDNICQNTQTLNINVSNNGNLRVDELLFRMFDIYGQPQGVYKNLTLNTEKTLTLIVVKQGVIDQVEVIPVGKEEKKRYICQNKRITEEQITFC
ncbi:hypothetical protein JXB11_01475 [Candidatus Woesearchaeota archaeon]|nr:hypothetical protein [Candidatus Woesearchaeota archaeon]